MPQAGTDAETTATCLDARGASDAGTPSPGRSDPQLTVTHVGNAFIHLTPVLEFFTGLQYMNIIFIFVAFGLPVVSCGFLSDPNMTYRYIVAILCTRIKENL